MDSEDYDYIIVSAGAAGSVLANRLSANGDASVLVLEAGGSFIPADVDDSTSWYKLLGSPVDWGYHSVPQPGLGGRRTYEPRGKIPGGRSNLYIMMHVRATGPTSTTGPTRVRPAGPTRICCPTSRSWSRKKIRLARTSAQPGHSMSPTPGSMSVTRCLRSSSVPVTSWASHGPMTSTAKSCSARAGTISMS